MKVIWLLPDKSDSVVRDILSNSLEDPEHPVAGFAVFAVWGEAESGLNKNLLCLKISGRVRFEFKSILHKNVEQGCEWECKWESARKHWQMKKQRDSSWECENVQEPTFSLSETLGMTGVALFVLALLQILSKDHSINQTMFHICVKTDYEWKPCLLSKLFFQGRRSDKFWTDCHTLSFEGHIFEERQKLCNETLRSSD